ncbi:MAG: LysM peptidoglycan-binding domain-containing protein [Actinomycetota bacterium]
MKRTGVRWGRIALILATVAVLVPAAAAAGEGEDHHPAPSVYVVQQGDTVWSIASQMAGPEEDPRPLVEAIGRRNRLESGAIVPGQELRIPA